MQKSDIKKTALLIGNTDGIGYEVTKKLLNEGFSCYGIAHKSSDIINSNYIHLIIDVADIHYKEALVTLVRKLANVHLCIYFAAISETLDWHNLINETKTFQINLMGAVITTEVILSYFIKQEFGTFIGLSSIVDMLMFAEAPSYSASKAALSKYWEGLALANKNKKIHICNVRFGFVDTKLVDKFSVKPFVISTSKAADMIISLISRPKLRFTYPYSLLPQLWLMKFVRWIKLFIR